MADMSGQHKYRAFISYSHADEKWAAWLHRALETYKVPKHLVGKATDYGPVPERIAPIYDQNQLPPTRVKAKTTNRMPN